MSEVRQRLFYDDCFVTKYKRLRGLVPGISCDSISTSKNSRRTVTNNVDYFSFKLTESQLYECWKIIHHKASMKDVKILNKLHCNENLYNRVEDLMLLIPSTSSKRLENSAWRAWAKTRFQLDELNPAELNWFKENDITWLYGPLIMNEEELAEQEDLSPVPEQPPTLKRCSSSSESLSSLSSADSMSSVDTASTSITSEDLTNFHSKPMTKPILKNELSSREQLRRLSFDDVNNKNKFKSKSEEILTTKRKKRVSFNSVMEKREIIDNEIYDYNLQFIDNERIGYGYYNL